MEICGKYFFQSRDQFEKVREYLERNGPIDMHTSDDEGAWWDNDEVSYIETYVPQTLEEIQEIFKICKED